MPGIPAGWLEYTPMGKPVDGTRFLAFKVPLKDALCKNMIPKNRFSPAMLLKEEPKLRMIIDLTNTARYYDKNEFTSNGIKHFKIFCPGKIVPTRKVVKQFFFAVDNFMNSEPASDELIGVHCTHGINRTGYFICSYMIQKMGFKPEEAIRVFQEARGHDIIREYLVNDLKNKRYTDDQKTPTNRPGSKSRMRRNNDSSRYNAQSSSKRNNIRDNYSRSNAEPINSRPNPFYRNKQSSTHNVPNPASFSNTRQDRRAPHQSMRQYNGFSESDCFYPQFTQNSSTYSRTSQLNYYDDNAEDTGSRYNHRRGHYSLT